MSVERRTVLQASGLIAVGGVVAACGGSSGSASASSSAAPAASSAAPIASSAAPASSAAAGSGAVAAVSDIPVGGGIILEDPAIVLTQPTAGDVKAFTAICTHEGCLVSQVVDNEIICPCHGSKYSGTDGSVIQGPATQALTAAGVSVDGGQVVING